MIICRANIHPLATPFGMTSKFRLDGLFLLQARVRYWLQMNRKVQKRSGCNELHKHEQTMLHYMNLLQNVFMLLPPAKNITDYETHYTSYLT